MSTSMYTGQATREQRPALVPPPAEVSPTGAPHLPPRLVRPAMALYVTLAAVSGYLALDAGPLEPYRWHLGLVLIVLGALLGIASPGLRRAGTALALLLALSLGAPALARSRATVFDAPTGSPGALTVAPDLALPLAPGYAVAVTLQPDGYVVPQLLAVGTLGLFNLAGRPLSLLLGGGFAAPGLAEVSPVGSLGLVWALPSGGPTEVSAGVLGTYGKGGAWSGGLTLVVSQLLE